MSTWFPRNSSQELNIDQAKLIQNSSEIFVDEEEEKIPENSSDDFAAVKREESESEEDELEENIEDSSVNYINEYDDVFTIDEHKLEEEDEADLNDENKAEEFNLQNLSVEQALKFFSS